MRLLLIEDDPDLQRTLATSLREEGYAVDTASDGVEGVRKALTGTYDTMVLDVMLPRLDGWGVLETIRPAVPTPVLMLTARDTVPDRIKGLDLGADDYLTKPFDIDELLARLRALIRRSAGRASTTHELGDVVIDTAARTVTRAGEEIALTPREYSLFEYLALHRGEVVSRADLYDHLYDEDDDSLSNLLDVHVSNLRKKLGHDLITTRRGHGYSIA